MKAGAIERVTVHALAHALGTRDLARLRTDLIWGGWPYDRETDTIPAETAHRLAPWGSDLHYALDKQLHPARG